MAVFKERLYVYTTKTNKAYIKRLSRKDKKSLSAVLNDLINEHREMNNGKTKKSKGVPTFDATNGAIAG